MEKFTFFWKAHSPFSQWHPATFEIKGITFNCAEQAMMYGKAILFGDHEIAEQILASTNPAHQKALGRKVRNFDKNLWERSCKRIVYKVNYAKFTQNQHLLRALLETKGTTLVEASPYDTIWGIGLDANHPDARDRSKWRGKNWLGEVLTQLRENLLKEGYE
jgi:ribA/ribD-fused uncharacterized protein